MHYILVFVAVLTVAACNPLDSNYLPAVQTKLFAAPSATAEPSDSTTRKHIPIVKSTLENDGEGSYSFNYETGNGITAEEKGEARGAGTKALGSYGFTLPNGEHVSVSYTADENGFVAQGSHIPVIPEPIRKALEEIAAAEARGALDDGQYHGEGLEESQYREGGAGAGTSAGVGVDIARAAGANQGYKY